LRTVRDDFFDFLAGQAVSDDITLVVYKVRP
jgi:hypothetical protein